MQKHYVVKIQRAMPWFYIGQVVSTKEISKWYTPEAISLLMTDGFLSTVSEIVPPRTLAMRYIDHGKMVHVFNSHPVFCNCMFKASDYGTNFCITCKKLIHDKLTNCPNP